MLIGLETIGFSVLNRFSIGVTAAQLSAVLSRLGYPAEPIESAPETDPNRLPGVFPVSADAVSDAGLFPIRPLSALVGRHATGKSAVFEAIDFLADCVRCNVQYACIIKDRGGFSKLRTFGFEGPMQLIAHCLLPETVEILTWTIALDCDRHGRPRVVAEQVQGIGCTKRLIAELGLSDIGDFLYKGDERYLGRRLYLNLTAGRGVVRSGDTLSETEMAESRQSALSIYGGLLHFRQLCLLARTVRRWYFCRVGSDPARSGTASAQAAANRAQLAAGGGHKHLDEYAANLSNVLNWLSVQDRRLYQRIMQRIAQRMPGIGKLTRRRVETAMSESERRLFICLLLMEDPSPRSLIMLENPDSGLFHEMVDALGLAMRDYTIRQFPRLQLLFSTHNPMMLDMLSPAEVWNFYRVRPAAADIPAADPAAVSVAEPSDTVSDAEDEPAEDDDNSGRAASAVRAACVAAVPAVGALYDEGIGMGSLWYSGHFDTGLEEDSFVY